MAGNAERIWTACLGKRVKSEVEKVNNNAPVCR